MNFGSILVTGGLGQIGSYIVEELISRQNVDHIYILDNLSSNKITEPLSQAELIKADIRSHNDVIDIMHDGKIEAVIHTAAQISVPYSTKSPRIDASVNIMGTLNLLDAAIKNEIEYFITFGSAAAIGEPKYLPVDPSHPRNPKSPYGISKAASEQYTLKYGETYNVHYNVIRPFNVYSSRISSGDPYSGVINVFKEQVRNNKPLTIHGDGSQTRDFIHAKDVANICLKLLNSDFKASLVNAATGNGTSILELAKIIGNSSMDDFDIKYLEPREQDIDSSIGKKSQFLNGEYIRIINGIKSLLPLNIAKIQD